MKIVVTAINIIMNVCKFNIDFTKSNIPKYTEGAVKLPPTVFNAAKP